MNQDDDGFVASLGIPGGFVMYCVAVDRNPLASQPFVFHVKQLM